MPEEKIRPSPSVVAFRAIEFVVAVRWKNYRSTPNYLKDRDESTPVRCAFLALFTLDCKSYNKKVRIRQHPTRGKP